MTDPNALSLPDLYAHFSAGGLVERALELARDEDLGPDFEHFGDLTSRVFVPGYVRAEARVVVRQGGVVAGLATLERLLHAFRADADARALVPDGARVESGTPVAHLSGRLRDILGVERTLLNLVGRLSGVATRAAAFVDAAKAGAGARAVRVLDTRKTSPGLRVLEKYAVRCGGAFCHRVGLYDAVLLKDNHLAGLGVIAGRPLAEAVREAARLARIQAPIEGLRFVEVEVDNLEQLRAILEGGGCGADIVLLDNFDLPSLRAGAGLRDTLARGVLLEASGGVSLDTIGPIAGTGVDRISAGSITHGATWLDVGLDVQTPAP